MSDRIMVMYLGKIAESGPAEDIYQNPQHPYSRQLLAAVPRPDPDARRLRRARPHVVIAADAPSLIA